jgi:hypothetical protein
MRQPILPELGRRRLKLHEADRALHAGLRACQPHADLKQLAHADLKQLARQVILANVHLGDLERKAEREGVL